MKNLILSVLIGVALISCKSPQEVGCVEQEFRQDRNNENVSHLYTFVWYRDEIVQTYRDSVSSITDPVAQARKREGLALLKVLKSVEVEPLTPVEDNTGFSAPLRRRNDTVRLTPRLKW